MDALQREIVALHRAGASAQTTAELALRNDDLRRRAKELGREITAEFVHSCQTSLRRKARDREARKNTK